MEQRSPEWFEARKNRITASMAGAILGLSPYRTRDDVMRAMVREAFGAESEFTGNIATMHGVNNEDGALVDYRIETTHEVEVIGFAERDAWAGCSPDGLVGEKGGVEIKCPYSLRKADAPVPFKTLDEQPHYGAQVQFSLWVTGRDWWHLFQYAPNGTKLEIVYPDLDWQAVNIPLLQAFHAEYLEQIASAKRAPGSCDHLADKRVTIDTPEAHRMADEWDAIKEQSDKLAERKADLLASMTALAGGKNALFAGRKLTLAERAGSVAWAKVAKAHCPDADVAPFTGKPSSYWLFS